VAFFEKHQAVSGLKEGDSVDDLFFVKFKKGVRPYAKGFCFELTLADNTGNIEYKYWGGADRLKVDSIYDSIKPDSVVHAVGRVSSYNGRLQLAANDPAVIEVLSSGQFDESVFVKRSDRDLDVMYRELLGWVELVGDAKVKDILTRVFGDKSFEERFKRHPGAIEIHHDWVGGLLQHTLEVLAYCRASWELFPGLSRDLLVAGAMLHDVGKLEEIKVTSRIKGTVRGQLAGHLVLGSIYVSRVCDEAGLEEDMKNRLLHVIVSHHGKVEYGSPKEPMFPEALAVYYADELSSKLAEMVEFVKESKTATEDDFMYHKRSGRNILLK
jgi:3'-5' exoribonuclease